MPWRSQYFLPRWQTTEASRWPGALVCDSGSAVQHTHTDRMALRFGQLAAFNWLNSVAREQVGAGEQVRSGMFQQIKCLDRGAWLRIWQRAPRRFKMWQRLPIGDWRRYVYVCVTYTPCGRKGTVPVTPSGNCTLHTCWNVLNLWFDLALLRHCQYAIAKLPFNPEYLWPRREHMC